LNHEGYEITYIDPDRQGVMDLAEIRKALRDDTILISIMMANNEVGTLQPIREIGEFARSRGVIMHTDAVQALGKVAVHPSELNVDLLSISAHKIYGPKG